MPAETQEKTADGLTDRELLTHIVYRLEQIWAELEEHRPLLALLKRPDGRPDMVGILGARRQARRAARDGT